MQTQTSFFACPTTGQVSWDPPVGHFVCVKFTRYSRPFPMKADCCSRSLPPNEEGEWWELSDDSRGGIPYYYQTKTSETVWERPEGFVIPLGIVQVCRFTRFADNSSSKNILEYRSWSAVITDSVQSLLTSLSQFQRYPFQKDGRRT